MATVNRVLVDTSAWYALTSASDAFHSAARAVYIDLLDSRLTLYTTSYVLVETFALVHRRLGFEPLDALVSSLNQVAEVYWIDSRVHKETWRGMAGTRDRRFSFVDWSSVVVAEELGAAMFSFDQEFRVVGLAVIPN